MKNIKVVEVLSEGIKFNDGTILGLRNTGLKFYLQMAIRLELLVTDTTTDTTVATLT